MFCMMFQTLQRKFVLRKKQNTNYVWKATDKINKFVNCQNIIVRSGPAFDRHDFKKLWEHRLDFTWENVWEVAPPPSPEKNKIGYNVSVGPPSSSVQTLGERKGGSLKEGRRVPDIDLAFFVAKSLPMFWQLMDFLCINFDVPFVLLTTKLSRLCC